MYRLLLFIIVTCVIDCMSFSQVYTKKQTRHRFAQLNLGLDLETNFGGYTQFINSNGELQKENLQSTFVPRFIIGGTHFWGHADFYIAIPLYFPSVNIGDYTTQYFRSVETAFKYYPWRIEHNKLRPYIGFSIAPFYFEQSRIGVPEENGPELTKTNFPLLAGITFNRRNHLMEIGFGWNYANKLDYYISSTAQSTVVTPPFYVNASYRFMLETTLSAEKQWESGRTQVVTEHLAAEGKLNSFYLGVGMSSAFWLGESTYNQETWPFLENYGISIMPEFGIGYYWHQPDMNVAIGYRGYGIGTDTYGVNQALRRKAWVAEVTKYLWDYHGFVPFIGPAISYEKLHFKESFNGQLTHDIQQTELNYGLTFGWDIRPNRLQSWLLRTNLRWFPFLDLSTDGESTVSFKNIEFNFIQLIVYPNRLF